MVRHMLMEISEIGKIRRQLGLTQAGLARAACVSQSLIAKIESGKVDPSYTNAKRIFDALDRLAKQSDAKARDIMNRRIIWAEPGQKASSVIRQMKKHGISQLPVLRRGRPVGIVTEGSLLEKMAEHDIRELDVTQVMGDCPPIVSETTSAEAVASLLRYFPIVLVADRGRMKGLITKSDLISYFPYCTSAASARTARSGLG
ncbi:MAG: CBS domain-containing protein [Candidatus Aenigmatarchaeota archaeon]